jgi:hypothetical protein
MIVLDSALDRTIESHSSALTNMEVLGQFFKVIESGKTARLLMTFDVLRIYLSEVLAYEGMAFMAITDTKARDEIKDLKQSVQKLELRIRLGKEPSFNDMELMFRLTEAIERRISLSLQDLKYFYRISANESRGIDSMKSFGNHGVFK